MRLGVRVSREKIEGGSLIFEETGRLSPVRGSWEEPRVSRGVVSGRITWSQFPVELCRGPAMSPGEFQDRVGGWAVGSRYFPGLGVEWGSRGGGLPLRESSRVIYEAIGSRRLLGRSLIGPAPPAPHSGCEGRRGEVLGNQREVMGS